MIACMGGWCSKRQQCPHYTESDRMGQREERLCLPRADGIRIIEVSPFRTIRVSVLRGVEVSQEATCAA